MLTYQKKVLNNSLELSTKVHYLLCGIYQSASKKVIVHTDQILRISLARDHETENGSAENHSKISPAPQYVLQFQLHKNQAFDKCGRESLFKFVSVL